MKAARACLAFALSAGCSGECLQGDAEVPFSRDQLIAGEGGYRNCWDAGVVCNRSVVQCAEDEPAVDVVEEVYFEGEDPVATWTWSDVKVYCRGTSYELWTGFVVEEACRP